jgi:hypothetical protein
VKKDTTRDLATIFSERVDVKFKKGDESNTITGRWCKICRLVNPFVTFKQKSSPKNREKPNLKDGKRAAFFTGGNSTCRAHIRSHYQIYKQRCKDNDIPENHHAIPRDIWKEMQAAKMKGKKQVKIDDILGKSTAPQEFTREGILHAVAQFVACDDQVWLEILNHLLY